MLLVYWYNKGIIKLNWLKNKKTLLIVGAIVFVVVLFSIKTSSTFKNNLPDTGLSGGLTYNTTTVKDLINKDSDKDGILDWEEGLWGTNPNSKDTNGDGVGDKEEIAKLKASLAQDAEVSTTGAAQDEENLSQTDKFSQELLTTVAALNQTGEMDPATIQKLGESLATQIESTPEGKIFTQADIKISKDDSVASIEKYDKATDVIMQEKPPTESSVTDILQEATTEDGDVDSVALQKLDPNIRQIEFIVNGMLKVEVPQSLVSPHLELLNALEKTKENLQDIEMVEKDALMAMAAINQYEESSARVETAFTKIVDIVKQKLSS